MFDDIFEQIEYLSLEDGLGSNFNFFFEHSADFFTENIDSFEFENIGEELNIMDSGSVFLENTEQFLVGNVSSLLTKICEFDHTNILSESIGSAVPIWKNEVFAPLFLRDNPMSQYFHHADYDGDGIQNFLDNYFGQGSESPFKDFLGASYNLSDNYQPLDFESFFEDIDSFYEQQAQFVNDAIESVSELYQDFREILTSNFFTTDSWHLQEAPNSCAVAVQTDILNDLGIDVSEFDMRTVAEEMGIYTYEGGTPLNYVGDLLEKHGIPVNPQRFDFSISDLIEAKEQGEKIIIGLDASEIWNLPDVADSPIEEYSAGLFDIPSAGHAVEFKGIIEDIYGNVKVVLDDPGRPDGQNFTVALEDFLDAWQDFSNFAVITKTN